MRIVFLNSLYPPLGPLGGAEATLRFLARSLADRGHECRVVTLTPDSTANTGEVDGIAVHYVPIANVYWPFSGHRPRHLRPLFQLLDACNPVMRRRLRRLLGELRPEVVHAHNLQGFSVAAWQAAHDRGIPLVQTLHDYYVACPRSTMWRPGRGNCRTPCRECRAFAAPRRRLSALPTSVTSVSHRVLARIRAAGVFTCTPARVVRGNNVDGDPHVPDHVPGDRLRLGFLGRLDPVKGVEQLFEALAGLSPTAVNLSIGGYGPPAYEAELKARAASLPNVTFLGKVDPGAFLTRIDLLVIPSRWEDPLPRVFHEALSYGVPSLVMPLGGLPECIRPGLTGFVAPSADAAGIQAVVSALLAEGGPSLPGMRAACRESAKAFAPDVITSQYEAILAAAVQGNAPPGWAGEIADP